jgi:Na+/H+-dicarboxylate symporter
MPPARDESDRAGHREPGLHTRDLGGKATTAEVTQAVCELLSRARSARPPDGPTRALLRRALFRPPHSGARRRPARNSRQALSAALVRNIHWRQIMRRFFGKLYVQVLIGVFAGVALGFFYPSLGVDVKPLGDVFIKLIKMVFAPIIFAMVVLGIARMENMKELGRVGARALIYFEVLSTFALGLGLLAVNLVGPGVGMNVDPATLDTKAISNYTAASAKPVGFVDFLLNMVPTSIVDALAKNDILQILVFAILFGVALSHIGPRAKPVVAFLDSFTHGIFAVVGMIMRLGPLAAFGAMAFTVGKYGLGSIVSLGKLMGTMYLTCFLFVVVVLGRSRGCRASACGSS